MESDKVIIYEDNGSYNSVYSSENKNKFMELYNKNKAFFIFNKSNAEKVREAIDLYLWSLNFNGDTEETLKNLERLL